METDYSESSWLSWGLTNVIYVTVLVICKVLYRYKLSFLLLEISVIDWLCQNSLLLFSPPISIVNQYNSLHQPRYQYKYNDITCYFSNSLLDLLPTPYLLLLAGSLLTPSWTFPTAPFSNFFKDRGVYSIQNGQILFLKERQRERTENSSLSTVEHWFCPGWWTLLHSEKNLLAGPDA